MLCPWKQEGKPLVFFVLASGFTAFGAKRMFLSRKSCIKQLLFLESEDIFFLKGEVGLAMFLFLKNVNFSIL